MLEELDIQRRIKRELTCNQNSYQSHRNAKRCQHEQITQARSGLSRKQWGSSGLHAGRNKPHRTREILRVYSGEICCCMERLLARLKDTALLPPTGEHLLQPGRAAQRVAPPLAESSAPW